MFYTGIGSRETPEHICNLMTKIAEKLSSMGWILRSGGADGADKAFMSGAKLLENYIPWKSARDSYTGVVPNLLHNMAYLQQVPGLNPLLYRSETTRLEKYSALWKLHARNVSQVLGLNLDTPSKFVILYAKPNGNGVSGGTNTAYQVAKFNNIPCFNLFIEEDLNRLKKFVEVK